MTTAVEVTASGEVDGTVRHGPLELTKGRHTVESGATLTFPAEVTGASTSRPIRS